MKTIIEKLGITPKEPEVFSRMIDPTGEYLFEEDTYRKIESERNEMLESLIMVCEAVYNPYGSVSFSDLIKLIEKATGKSWDEIKELINEG